MTHEIDVDTMAEDGHRLFAERSHEYLRKIDERIEQRHAKLGFDDDVIDVDPVIAMFIELKNDIVDSMEQGVQDLFQVLDIFQPETATAH